MPCTVESVMFFTKAELVPLQTARNIVPVSRAGDLHGFRHIAGQLGQQGVDRVETSNFP